MARTPRPNVEFQPVPAPCLRLRGAPARIVRIVVGVIGIIGITGYLYLLTPWEADYRSGGMRVIEREIAVLPPPTDASVGSPLVTHDPPTAPTMDLEYVTLARTCGEIESYYEQTATQAGWKLYKRASTDVDVTWRYTKVSQGYQLAFDLNCQEHATSTPPYQRFDLSMEVPFPFNITFVGGLVAHGIINPFGDAAPSETR